MPLVPPRKDAGQVSQGEGPCRPVRRPGEHERALAAPSHACRTKSKQDRARAGVAAAALLKEKRRRRGVRVASASSTQGFPASVDFDWREI